MTQLKALLSALIIFLPLVVGARGPEPFSVRVGVESRYMGQTVYEPYVHVTLLRNTHPATRLFEGYTTDGGTFCAGFYAPLPAPIRLLIHRDTPGGPLRRVLPLLDSGGYLVATQGGIMCFVTYDWDTDEHLCHCHTSK